MAGRARLVGLTGSAVVRHWPAPGGRLSLDGLPVTGLVESIV
jgi:hypothetical protein